MAEESNSRVEPENGGGEPTAGAEQAKEEAGKWQRP